MNVALCLSGQPRFVSYAFPNIYHNIIKPYNPDIFVHSWYDSSLISTNFVDYSVNGWDNNKPESKYTEGVDKEILDLYKPKKWIFENQKKFVDSRLKLDEILKSHAKHYTREYFVSMLYSSWYSVYKSNLLKEEYRLENNFHYDFVIRARFDTTINQQLNLKNLDNNCLYTDYRNNLPPRMIEDWFGYGSNKVMNIYSAAFNFMEYAVEISNNFDKIFCGEVLVYETMNLFNIKHVRVKNLIHLPVRQNMINK